MKYWIYFSEVCCHLFSMIFTPCEHIYGLYKSINENLGKDFHTWILKEALLLTHSVYQVSFWQSKRWKVAHTAIHEWKFSSLVCLVALITQVYLQCASWSLFTVGFTKSVTLDFGVSLLGWWFAYLWEQKLDQSSECAIWYAKNLGNGILLENDKRTDVSQSKALFCRVAFLSE